MLPVPPVGSVSLILGRARTYARAGGRTEKQFFLS